MMKHQTNSQKRSHFSRGEIVGIERWDGLNNPGMAVSLVRTEGHRKNLGKNYLECFYRELSLAAE